MKIELDDGEEVKFDTIVFPNNTFTEDDRDYVPALYYQVD